MSRTNRHSWRMLACLVATTLLLSAGCRQFGVRASQGAPTPIEPSVPAYASPSESSGPVLQEIPLPPPSAASTLDPATYGPPRRLGWSKPRYAPQEPALDSLAVADAAVPKLGEPASTASIEPTSGTDAAVPEQDNDVALLLPPDASVAEDGLVPPPSDAEDEPFELNAVPQLPTAWKVVEIDITEFLAELEHIPAPIKAQAQSEPITTPVIATAPVITGPLSFTTSPQTIPSWPPNGVDHGIAITPGPTGTGNRIEMFPIPTLPWNSGRVVSPSLPPAWSSMNSWAGQNSDWGGRQFR